MYLDITVDLDNDLAIIIPLDDGESPPIPINFERMDIDLPYDYRFYDKDNRLVKVIPRSSVRQINFQPLGA